MRIFTRNFNATKTRDFTGGSGKMAQENTVHFADHCVNIRSENP